MSLFQIAIRNIKKSIGNYSVYFISMIVSILVYFTFTSIQYNRQVVDMISISIKIKMIFNVCAIIIALFAAIFMWYSNTFFLRCRKQEVGMYCLLGVRKSQVASMLFYENLILGLAALVIGIISGMLFSRLFTMILVRLMGFGAELAVTFSLEAVINTIVVFFIIFLITSLHSYSIVYRYQLIELFRLKDDNRKKPRASIILTLLSLVLLGAGYFFAVTFNFVKLYMLPIILVLTVMGTYILFSSLVVFLVKILKADKKGFYKGLNLVSISQLLFRVGSNARLLATISILVAATVTTMGVAGAFYYDQIKQIEKATPFGYVYPEKDSKLDEKVEKVISQYPQNRIKNSFVFEYLIAEGKYPNVSATSGKPEDYDYGKDNIVSESTMKSIMAVKGQKNESSLKQNEVLMFFYTMYSEKIMINPTGKTIYYKIDGKEAPFIIKDCINRPLVNNLDFSNPSVLNVLVVNDDIYEKLKASGKLLKAKVIDIDNPKLSKDATSDVVKTLRKSGLYGQATLQLSSYYENFSNNMTKGGILVFLAAFLGIVFLACTGSIIFFKQLSEANNERGNYEILKKMGASKTEIKHTIAKQMVFVFGLPLVVGITHSLVALQIVQPFLKTKILYPSIVAAGIYTLIYIAYYLLTVRFYYKLVNI